MKIYLVYAGEPDCGGGVDSVWTSENKAIKRYNEIKNGKMKVPVYLEIWDGTSGKELEE